MRRAWVLGTIVTSGCLLTQSLSGLSGGAADAVAEAGADAQPDAGGDARADAGGDAASDSGGDAASVDAGVPIAFVQANANGTSSSPTLTAPFGADLQAHNAIVVAVAVEPSSLTLMPTMPITDTLGNAYSIVSGPSVGNGLNHYIAVALDTPAGFDTVTAHFSGVPTLAYVYVHEYSGIATSAAFDKAASASGMNNANAIDGMKSGTVTTTSPRELIFGFAETGSARPGTGFTARSLFMTNVTEDRIVSAIGTYEATATMTNGPAWSMMVATFRGR